MTYDIQSRVGNEIKALILGVGILYVDSKYVYMDSYVDNIYVKVYVYMCVMLLRKAPACSLSLSLFENT